jgi:SAM-dependent methyltransferase
MVFDQSAELYDLFYGDKDYRGEARTIHGLVTQRSPDARTLLDVACGTGSHLAVLKRWYQVEGLDLDGGLLEVAARRLPDTPLQQGDMRNFDLGRTFDVVTCLFSSIAYVRTAAGLSRAIKAMAGHVARQGLLIVEPWLTPTSFKVKFPGRLLKIERPDLQAVRMSVSRVEGRLSFIDFHYLVAQPGQIRHLTETHSMGLFSEADYRSAFARANMIVEFDPVGLIGRGLWIGTRMASNVSQARR